MVLKEVGVLSCIIPSSALVFEMESGLAWPLRLVLSSHLAISRCGSLVGGDAYLLSLIFPPSTSVTPAGALMSICSCSKGLKMACKEEVQGGKSLVQRETRVR